MQASDLNKLSFLQPDVCLSSDVIIEMPTLNDQKVKLAFLQFPKLSEKIKSIGQRIFKEKSALEKEHTALKESKVYWIHQNSDKISALPFGLTLAIGIVTLVYSSIFNNMDGLISAFVIVPASFGWLALPYALTCGQTGLEESPIEKKLTHIQDHLKALEKTEADLKNLQSFMGTYTQFQGNWNAFCKHPAEGAIKSLLEELESVLMLMTKKDGVFNAGLAKLILLEQISKHLPTSSAALAWLSLKNVPVAELNKELKSITLWKELKLIPPAAGDYFYYFKHQNKLHSIPLARHVEKLLCAKLENSAKV